MQQKIQFLSSIIHDPELIILDEPFSGLDPVSTKTIKSKITEYRDAGRTVILSTHMMEQAQKLCDRILMLNKGQQVLYGTVEVIRHEGLLEIFPEEGISAQAVLQELVKRAELLRFEQAFPSLNDIFIETVESASGE